MTELLLSLHVLAAIVTVGSVTVAASMFPRYALKACAVDAAGADAGSGGRSAAIATVLHRVCSGYAVAGVAVPVLGIATGAQLGVLTDTWLIASLILTLAAAVLLGLAVLPAQRRLLDLAATPSSPGRWTSARPMAARIAMLTGIFNLLWAIVVVLMIVRPGSTTSA
ncbi:hypothetical protein DY218_29400 [Streptomyces triticagri]|uniref:DUF2269 family protein n=1 Tax=Streptomyces triticagri TaxID=2293568 RepID=A0A372LXS8_9ACTN|nr:hypothetical protein [Streptomyces triticagri]RFU83105.1 hypothetical protein DY218_29400 [Streptomyces triticagri]